MYHAEVALISSVEPVDIEGRAPWPKIKILGSFELVHVAETRGEKPHPKSQKRNVAHAQLVEQKLCVICKLANDRAKTACTKCAAHRAKTMKAWRNTRANIGGES